MSCPDPGEIAKIAEADQAMAAAGERVHHYVDRFRTHTAAVHDGDTMCAFAQTMVAGLVEGGNLCRLYAAAVAELAKEPMPPDPSTSAPAWLREAYASVSWESHPDGHHDVYTMFNGYRVVLVSVRPVGTIDFGQIRDTFTHGWVPPLIAALIVANDIAARPKPWEPYSQNETGSR
jgi:hypothetical protein